MKLSGTEETVHSTTLEYELAVIAHSLLEYSVGHKNGYVW